MKKSKIMRLEKRLIAPNDFFFVPFSGRQYFAALVGHNSSKSDFSYESASALAFKVGLFLQTYELHGQDFSENPGDHKRIRFMDIDRLVEFVR
jgi:hypothetical protein